MSGGTGASKARRARTLQNVWPHGVLSGALSTLLHSLQPNSLSRRCCSVMSFFFLGCAERSARIASRGT